MVLGALMNFVCAVSVTTEVIDGSTYALVAAYDDDGLQIIGLHAADTTALAAPSTPDLDSGSDTAARTLITTQATPPQPSQVQQRPAARWNSCRK